MVESNTLNTKTKTVNTQKNYLDSGKALTLLGITAPKTPTKSPHTQIDIYDKTPTEPIPSTPNFNHDTFANNKISLRHSESEPTIPIKEPKTINTNTSLAKHKSDNQCIDVMELSSPLTTNKHNKHNINNSDNDIDHSTTHDTSTTIDSLNILVADGFYSKKDINSLDELRKYLIQRNIQNAVVNMSEPIAKSNNKNTTSNFAKSRSDRRFNKSLSVFN